MSQGSLSELLRQEQDIRGSLAKLIEVSESLERAIDRVSSYVLLSERLTAAVQEKLEQVRPGCLVPIETDIVLSSKRDIKEFCINAFEAMHENISLLACLDSENKVVSCLRFSTEDSNILDKLEWPCGTCAVFLASYHREGSTKATLRDLMNRERIHKHFKPDMSFIGIVVVCEDICTIRR